MEPPSWSHLLGADQVGRDILSRVIAGTRYTLLIAFCSVAVATALGVALGGVAGHLGGWVDRILTALVDLLLTMPNLVLAIAIASAVGASARGLSSRSRLASCLPSPGWFAPASWSCGRRIMSAPRSRSA